MKNVASQSLEVKKLVYLYLLHYAEKRPDEALLSINCFQKDLSDINPLVRAYALRAMAGIRLHVVAPLVLVAIGKCARDPSPYVRKCAAHAVTKLHDLHLEENTSAIEELVSVLLSDNSPIVVGAAVVAFKSACPDNLSLIGKNFRRLCEILPDVDEWGQIILMEILLRYVIARHGLVRESIIFTSNPTMSCQSEKGSANVPDMVDNDSGFTRGDMCDFKSSMSMYRYYFEGQEELLSFPSYENGCDDKLSNLAQTSSQNDSVKLLLQCTSPLFWSQNSAVVLAAAGVHWIMAPKEEVKMMVKPLLFLLRSTRASKYVVLCNVQMFAKAAPSLFEPYFEDFFISSSDLYQTRALKLEILSTIATDSSIQIILEEFQDYIKDPDKRFVADTVAAIGLCAQRLPSVANVCLGGLLALTVQESSTGNPGEMERGAGVMVEAIMSIKAIIKHNPVSHEKIIVRLAQYLDTIKEPAARALIVWILGEYCSVGEIIPKIVPTVLQYLAQCFSSEELETKHQILNTTAKVVLYAQEEEIQMLRMILTYIVELAKCDLNYDIRDRARLVEKLTPCHTTSPCQEEDISYLSPGGIYNEFMKNLFTGRLPEATYPSHEIRFYLPGSLSHIVLHAAPGYGPLPKPCSLLDNDLSLSSELVLRSKVPSRKVFGRDSFETDEPETASGSSYEESGSNYGSKHSVVSSVNSEGTGSTSDSSGNGSEVSHLASNGAGDDKGPLVHFSDGGSDHGESSQIAADNISSFSSGLEQLMSKSALESWLDDQPSTSSLQNSSQQATARISIKDLGLNIKPKLHTLLDPTNGNGLRVEYSFSSEISSISPLLVCIEVSFSNCSTEILSSIVVKDDESDGNLESASDVPVILPVEEIESLDPGQTTKKVLQVRLRHHLLPIKLAVFSTGKKYMTKLWPEMGYFLRPLFMNSEDFTDKQSHLRGMFECVKRCAFSDHIRELDSESQSSMHGDKIFVVSRSLASKVLSNANLYLVSVDLPVSFNIDDASGLCLRFSGEILSSSKPCLIMLHTEGRCFDPLDVTVKINCEDTVFSLNLLNRLVALLS